MEQEITRKMRLLNKHGVAVIFIVTGGNGTGKSVIAKSLLTRLPFHQSFNLGAITKTIRFLNEDVTVSKLENFDDKHIDNLFTPIVQYSCCEYQRNGVNVIVDGVQIDTKSKSWSSLITGGVILNVNTRVRLLRNDLPDTHFKRKIDISITDHYEYKPSDLFYEVDNSHSFEETYLKVLDILDSALTKQLIALKNQELEVV